MMMIGRQVCWILGFSLFVSLVSGSWQEEMSDNSITATASMMSSIPPLAVLPDTPLSMAKSMSKVPLVAVPQKDLIVMKNAQITSMSPDSPFVTCLDGQSDLTEAMPAVKMSLKTPFVVNARHGRAVVDFPSYINVIHRGALVPIPVGALIAPIVNYQRLGQPVLIKTIYAVPSFPFNYQLPPQLSAPAVTNYAQPFYSYQPYSPYGYNFYSQPFYNYRPFAATSLAPAPLPAAMQPAPPMSDAGARPQTPPQRPVMVTPSPTIQQPSNMYGAQQTPASDNLPKPVAQSVSVSPSTGQPIVTVLDFPDMVANPPALYYQPPISPDSEFENREPPQPVAPAGIVQSTQPQQSQQPFMNSKESIYLVTIKEDLKKRA